MGILDYFKPVSVMTEEEVRVFLKKRNPGEYTLIDVRQPREYEKSMEGGMRVGKALQWAQGKPLGMILELAMSHETNAHDLYIKMERKIDDVHSGEVFSLLAGQEKLHFGKLAALLEWKI